MSVVVRFLALSHRLSLPIGAVALVLFVSPMAVCAASAQSRLAGLATSAIETADKRLSVRLTGILQVLAASAGGAPAFGVDVPSAGGGGADLAIHQEAIHKFGDRILFDLWVKPYPAIGTVRPTRTRLTRLRLSPGTCGFSASSKVTPSRLTLSYLLAPMIW